MKWIKVDDQMPPINKRVLYYDKVTDDIDFGVWRLKVIEKQKNYKKIREEIMVWEYAIDDSYPGRPTPTHWLKTDSIPRPENET